MIDKLSSFSERFQALRAGKPYDKLSEELLAATGKRVSAQTLHNWATGKTDITEDNLQVLASFYKVRPAWLRYGEGDMHESAALEDVLKDLPEPDRQQVFDFVRYKIERADTMIASDKIGSYLTMIDRIKADMERKKE